MVSRYVTNGPVKQEGICLLPPPHYRMMPPQRSDGFHVNTPAAAYVQQQQQQQQQQQPNQQGNQGLRGIAPTGPPNQASTPPTNDLKVQTVQQPMNIYVPQVQQQVRGAQATYYRSAAPPTQTSRMSNQSHRNQQLYQAQSPYVQMPVPQMYIAATAAAPMQYYNTGPRQQSYVQPTAVPVFSGQHITAAGYSFANQAQTQNVPYQYYQQIAMPARTGHPPQATAAPPNPTQTLANIPLPQAAQPQPVFQRQTNKRRSKAIPVIDPETGKDRLTEIYEQDNSHPPSGESSARQTPQPVQHNNHKKEMQAIFAKQVAQAINSDDVNSLVVDEQQQQQQPPLPNDHNIPIIGDHNLVVVEQQQQQAAMCLLNNTMPPPQQQQQQQIVQSTNRFDHIVQSSNLKVQAKEFVSTSSSPSNAAKETTPIVSAISDAIEITIPSKQAKDRESPAKGRKQLHSMREPNKDSITSVKEIATAANVVVVGGSNSDNIKESSINKNDNSNNNNNNNIKQKEIVVNAGNTNTAAIIAPASSVTVTSNNDSNNSTLAAIIVKDNKENTLLNRDNTISNKLTKKDNKIDMKVSSSGVECDSVTVPIVPVSLVTPAASLLSSSTDAVAVNAKTKQSASQRSKDVQKQQQPQQVPVNQKQQQQQQQQQQQNSVAVPQPQPAKPSNRSTKKSELNQKGANKEGTDMDAFNDSNRLDAIIANINSTSNDIINANTVSNNSGTTNNVEAVITAPLPSATPVTTAATTTIVINDSNKNKTYINNNNITNSNEMTINRLETKVLPKSKIDITDIVKEKPKIFKPFMAPVVATTTASSVDTRDETDRAVVSTNNNNNNNNINDKLVQAKNETNAKVSATDVSSTIGSNNNNNNLNYNSGSGVAGSAAAGTTPAGGATVVEATKSDLPYREGQWAPHNLDGKKVYERDFLIALRNIPASRTKPDNLPDLVLADDRGRLSDGRYSSGGGGRTDFTTPPFVSYGGRSSSQRASASKRPSQSGKINNNNSSGKGSNKPNVVKLSISVREEVKLHEAENAWKPARLQKTDPETEDSKKTDSLYSKVRGVLNKLTPQKFDTLVSQVRALQIDTSPRLQGVIDLVFEKAVDEPNFSVAYALMCRELALMRVPTSNSTEEKEEYVNFRKLLVTRCQVEFEKQSYDESIRNDKLAEIEACPDPEKKKELTFDLDEYDRKLRMKSVGNIRFIGELFKQQMLTVNIMLKCLENLLANHDEENLECLCKLLTTIGKELEATKNVDLSSTFNVMKDLVDKKLGKVSSRVRFMLQDVIDLRRAKWVPRRQDLNPKTIDQIQKEAENEHLTIQAMNSGPMQQRNNNNNNDRNMPGGSNSGGGGGGGSNSGGGGGSGGSSFDRKRRNNVSSEDGWQTASRNNRQAFTVVSEKLKNKAPLMDEPLGSRSTFNNWSRGSNVKTEPLATNTANMYAALDNIDSDKRPMVGSRSSSNKDSYSSKGPSMERNYNKQSYDGRNSSRSGSRSGSQHRTMDGSSSSGTMSRERNTPPIVPVNLPKPIPTMPIASTSGASSSSSSSLPPQQQLLPPPSATASAALPVDILSGEQLERRVKNNLDEFINDSCSLDEYIQDMQLSVPVGYSTRLVVDGYLHVLERSITARRRSGSLFAGLINSNVLSVDDYCRGLEEVLSQAEDLTIDIPKFWDYIAEMLVDLICDEALSLSRLHVSCEILITQGYASKFLASLFKLVIAEKGPNFLLHCWQNSGLRLEDFMASEEINRFIENNHLEVLCGGAASALISQNQLTYEQIHNKLLEFFTSKLTFDDIITWISANVGERINDNQFIRVLMTAILENSIDRSKLCSITIRDHYKLLSKYVDNNSTFELQCLNAIHALIHKMEYPSGLIFSIFNQLYDDSVISQESFLLWEKSDDLTEQKWKGVALKLLTSFYTQLKENDNDGDLSTSEDET